MTCCPIGSGHTVSKMNYFLENDLFKIGSFINHTTILKRLSPREILFKKITFNKLLNN